MIEKHAVIDEENTPLEPQRRGSSDGSFKTAQTHPTPDELDDDARKRVSQAAQVPPKR